MQSNIITVDDESRLVALLHQILQSKNDYFRMAEVFKIKNYADEYEKHNVKTIVKNIC